MRHEIEFTWNKGQIEHDGQNMVDFRLLLLSIQFFTHLLGRTQHIFPIFGT